MQYYNNIVRVYMPIFHIAYYNVVTKVKSTIIIASNVFHIILMQYITSTW